ncbi:MAG: hypothetical protein PHU70_02290 [Dehalococcoidia bacterium]|nr:hypothetical protein [Dehalococcoidia bacterium]MDD5647521.1 hypothetical protein [Dehalococcoidia bacterium]
MRNVILLAMILLLAASGCITFAMGGGTANTAPVVISFTVNPVSINPGDTAVLSWEVQNASSISIDPGMPAAASTGAEKVAPSSTTTYILTASNSAGSTRATALLTVASAAGTQQPPASGLPAILSFSASPSSISPGGSAVLSWTTSNATGATISGIGAVGTNGVTSVSPAVTTTYILTATNGTNSVTGATSVEVTAASTTPPASSSRPNILYFTANPSSVALGGSIVLSWDVLDASSVILQGYGPVQSSGSLTVYTSGTGTITFQLTAQNSAGSSIASTTVSVSP